MKKEFSRLVHGNTNPYDAVDPNNYPDDMRSWGGSDATLDRVIQIVRPRRVVEFGTWKGASIIRMARAAYNLGIPQSEFIAVDPHVASAGLWIHNPAAMHRRPNGECGTYEIFLSNVKRAGLEDYITPFRATNSIATAIMQEHNLTADLIYIDGDHDPVEVKADLIHAQKIMHPQTIIMCDDYDHPRIRGVSQAVEEFLSLNSRFSLVAAPDTPRALYTENIRGEETGKKAVLALNGSKFASALRTLATKAVVPA